MGNVTFVVLVAVNVIGNAPAVVNESAVVIDLLDAIDNDEPEFITGDIVDTQVCVLVSATAYVADVFGP